jgi:hypothetical protein
MDEIGWTWETNVMVACAEGAVRVLKMMGIAAGGCIVGA